MQNQSQTKQQKNWNGKILIIGAGAAGLSAGYLLRQQKIPFTILEASSTWGGRVKTLKDWTDFPVEMGAEEIHGRNSVLFDMVKHFGYELTRLKEGQAYYWNGKSLMSEDLVWDLYGAEMETVENFIQTLEDYHKEDISVEEVLNQKDFSPMISNFLKARLGNEYGTSNSRLGMWSLADSERYWSSGSGNYCFKKASYKDFFEKAFKDIFIHIRYQSPVKSIDYQRSTIKITTQGGETFYADKVIVTVPLNILKAQDIEFTPELPLEKLVAIQKIGMDAGLKIQLKFTKPFWNPEMTELYAELIPEYWVAGFAKSKENRVLTAFINGEGAEKLIKLGEKESIRKILNELDDIFDGQASENYQSHLWKDWSKEPYIRGAYSYPSPDSADARKILAKSITDKVFFAGEATHTAGHFATVHGAMETADFAVQECLKTIFPKV